ncbi:MAG TPA: hypothetical protein VF444_04545 [Pseudonocardiaceae bacterium]
MSARKHDERSSPRPPRGPAAGRGEPADTAPPRVGRTTSGWRVEDEPPEAVFEIQVADGAEGERLAHLQARVLWEVTAWLARNKSEHGQKDAE